MKAIVPLLLGAVAGHAAAAGADITVARISVITAYPEVDGLRAYSFGFDACNRGDAPIEWVNNTNRHPVFASQLYRLHEGRFEQLGLSFVFHEFFPLEINSCGGGCTPSGDSQTLGVGCANVNSASIAGSQPILGPRTEIDPASGAFPYPFTGLGQTGDAVFKRLQAREVDLALPGARYFFEGHYIAPDDAESGNANNNVSHREATFAPGTFAASFIGATAEAQPAIYAWGEADPDVLIAEATAPDGGRYIVASRVRLLPTGAIRFRYEYAVYNMNSSMTAMAFEAPHEGRDNFPRVFDVGFHDVDYHSGDPVDGTDWPGLEAVFSARWETPAPAEGGVLPNDIRWGTLYNFGFTSFEPPVQTTVRVRVRGAGGASTAIEVPAFAAGAARCGDADFAEPFFVLDLADLQLFVQLFTSGLPGADLQPPLGVLDLADVQAFIAAFGAGCR